MKGVVDESYIYIIFKIEIKIKSHNEVTKQ